MKRQELIIGKAYYLTQYNDWASNGRAINGWRYKNLTECAIKNKGKKVILVETQLKTEYDRKYRTREVLVRNSRGEEQWVSLTHIRGEFASCIKSVYEWHKEVDDRAKKYADHLRRKQQREVYKPAYEAMMTALKEHGGYVSGWDRVQNAFKLEHLIAITEGLALLKTQKPELKVAS